MRREITLTFIAAIILAATITAIVADEESNAYTDYDVMYNGVGYDLSGVDAKVVYVSSISSLYIPEAFAHNGIQYTVTGIDSLTGDDGTDTTIRYVTIPSTVWSIQPDAFDGCPNLRSIEVSDGSSSFVSEDGVLYNKNMNRLVRVPQSTTDEFIVREGVTEIEDHAFYDCRVEQVVFSSDVRTVGTEAFAECHYLTDIDLGEVIDIGTSAFAGSSLPSVYVPSTVTSMTNAFDGAANLAFINVAQSNPSFYSDDSGLLYDDDGSQLIKCPEGKQGKVNVPSGTNIVGSRAFHSCSEITSVELPDSLARIESGAFVGCSGLTGINIPSAVNYISSNAFECMFFDEYGNALAINASSLAGHTYGGDGPEQLYRDWTGALTYTVYYQNTYGVSYEPFHVKEGETFTLQNGGGDRDGYRFTGWKCDGITYPGGAEVRMQDHDMYFRAQWEEIVPTSISLDRTEVVMGVSDHIVLEVTINPMDASNTKVTWRSSDPDVVTVDSDGRLRAVGPGVAVVTVTTEEGNLRASCVVTVDNSIMGMNPLILYALIAIAIIAVIMVAVIFRYSGKTKTINELNNLKIRPPRRHLK